MINSSSWLRQSKAVVFDLDGTLYDSSTMPWRIVLGLLAGRHNVLYSWRERKARKLMRGQRYADEGALYDALFRCIDPQRPDEVRRWYFDSYMPLQARIIGSHCAPYSWVLPCLNELRSRGIKVALYSDYGHTHDKVRSLGIPTEMFDLIVDAPSLGGLKPNAESARQLLELMQVSPADTLFVGDREDCDVASALAVGSRALLLKKVGKECTFVERAQ